MANALTLIVQETTTPLSTPGYQFAIHLAQLVRLPHRSIVLLQAQQGSVLVIAIKIATVLVYGYFKTEHGYCSVKVAIFVCLLAHLIRLHVPPS